ncbi:hypothetical protein J2046_006802 [Rhizobium petrolearium]|nr:hypothetical protein [Neorhizobium petrolearium]
MSSFGTLRRAHRTFRKRSTSPLQPENRWGRDADTAERCLYGQSIGLSTASKQGGCHSA